MEFVSIGGPYSKTRAGTRRAAARCSSASRERRALRKNLCARQILSTLARRAYRRPVTEDDVQTLLEFLSARAARTTASTPASSAGFERILAAPSFLFRVEREPANLAPGTAYRLSDLDLASRLSFFLWSSIPDDELLDAAFRGKLSDPAVLEQQVRRMLRDPRSQALVDNFANQWLELGKLAGVVPDSTLFPDSTRTCATRWQQETRLFIDSQLQEDRSVMDLLTATTRS